MARIRSVHPAFFTDEDIVEVSTVARLLLIGLGTEADDKGVFPWKPKTIKMRLFPADMIEIVGPLEELEAANLIRSYEVDGKSYGCIRNFRKHQRPKSPNDIHPMPDDFRIYVGLSEAIGEIDVDKEPEIPPKEEIAPQMEDGGEDVEEKDTDVSLPKKPPKRKSRIRDDAEISEAMIRAAEKRGHSLQEAEAQFQKFKNDALAKGKTFVDWDRAFVTWLDSEYFRPITTGGHHGQSRNSDGSGAAMAQRAGERAVARLMDFRKGPNAS